MKYHAVGRATWLTHHRWQVTLFLTSMQLKLCTDQKAETAGQIMSLDWSTNHCDIQTSFNNRS